MDNEIKGHCLRGTNVLSSDWQSRWKGIAFSLDGPEFYVRAMDGASGILQYR
jgi:hypothetical protein